MAQNSKETDFERRRRLTQPVVALRGNPGSLYNSRLIGQPLMPLSTQRQFNGSIQDAICLMMEQMNQVCRRQDTVLQEIGELRRQNSQFQIAFTGLTAMSENQARIIRDCFSSFQPNLDEMVRKYHQAEEEQQLTTIQNNQLIIGTTFMNWIPSKKAIFVVIVVGLTTLIGFFEWRFIANYWGLILNFIEENGAAILNKIPELAESFLVSPLFKTLSDAISTGKELSLKECADGLFSWKNMFSILSLFLTVVSQKSAKRV